MKYIACFSIIFCLTHGYSLGEIWQPSIDECNIDTGCTNLKFTEVPFNAKREAELIAEAINKMDFERKIIDILLIRNSHQRYEILHTFNSMYQTNLVEVLERSLHGKVRHLILSLMMPLADFYATEIHEAITSFPFRHGSLFEILGTLNNKGIRNVTNRYKEIYGISLRKVLAAKNIGSNEYKTLCNLLTLGNRDVKNRTDGTVNEELVEQDAKDLYQAGEGEWDSYVYNDLLVHRSFPHLIKVFEKYNELTPLDFRNTITNGFHESELYTKALTTLIDMVIDREKFFASRIKKSLKGQWFFRHKTLTRIIVGRSEIDLGDILRIFETMYRQNFIHEVKKAKGIMGNFKEALVRFLEEKSKSPLITPTSK